MNPALEPYFRNAEKWQEELRELRRIVLECPLSEEMKWSKPFYTLGESNVAVLWGFKGHCALGFCKGALLADPEGILVSPGEHSQAVRKIVFTSVREIREKEAVIKAYLREAIAAEEAGLEVAYRKPDEFVLPEELERKLADSPNLRAAFEALSPGRRRGYFLFISAPKQSKTREARVEKCRERILAGLGLNDRPGRGEKR